MQRLCVVWVTVLLAHTANAQTFAEWFSQKKTQKKYLAQQILLLGTLLKFSNDGYKLVKNGLNVIGDIKTGDFNLHKTHFSELKNVSPKVRRYLKVGQISTYLKDIKTLQMQSLKRVRTVMVGRPDHVAYITRVYANLINKATELVSSLVDLLTDGALSMKEDERLERIDKIHAAMRDLYQFCQSFSSDENQFLFQIEKEKSGDWYIGRMYNF